jgi:hypothetical protein
MISDPKYNQLLELSWRRPLTADEEAQLEAFFVAHPEAREDWKLESGLNTALGHLPQVTVASNFTSRVLGALALEDAAEQRRSQPAVSRASWLSRWLPRLAFTGVALVTALVSREQILSSRRAKLGESVVRVAEVSSLPSPEILKDFDAISALSETPGPDMALLTALK